MSRLEDLIKELCPDGVEYKTIGEIATDIYRGSGIKRTEVTDSGIPCVRYGEIYTTYDIWFTECVSHTNEAKISNAKYFEHGDILFAITGEKVEEIAKSIAYLGNDKCMAGGDIVVLKHHQDPKYLSYALSTNEAQVQKSSGKVKSKVVHSSVPAIKAIRVPIPPLEIQREIVRILDEYTEKNEALKAELTAELTARKKQYEVYRDMAFNCEGCRYQKIAEIADTNIGLATSVTKHKRETGIRLLHNSDIQQNHIVLKNEEFISEEFAAKNAGKILHKNDIITVHTGDVGTSAVIDDEYDGSIGFTTITTRVKDTAAVLPQYLCHYLNSHKCKEDIASRTISDRSNLNQKNYEKLIVPIPSLEKQKRIVEMLDHFDKLSNDISEGLSAEIEARQKQYGHYRDKLLTFKEKEQN
ncbi:MAG: restriction endonuclease subunit S [Clostridia bacterium]|nr:restriction endonuclease subunit S [Clostridia bacterium]